MLMIYPKNISFVLFIDKGKILDVAIINVGFKYIIYTCIYLRLLN